MCRHSKCGVKHILVIAQVGKSVLIHPHSLAIEKPLLLGGGHKGLPEPQHVTVPLPEADKAGIEVSLQLPASGKATVFCESPPSQPERMIAGHEVVHVLARGQAPAGPLLEK